MTCCVCHRDEPALRVAAGWLCFGCATGLAGIRLDDEKEEGAVGDRVSGWRQGAEAVAVEAMRRRFLQQQANGRALAPAHAREAVSAALDYLATSDSFRAKVIEAIFIGPEGTADRAERVCRLLSGEEGR